MEIARYVAVGIIAVILISVIKVYRPDMALKLSIVAAVVMFFPIILNIKTAIDLIISYTKKTSIDPALIAVLLKIIGISYLAEFGIQICKDANESAIASKIELAAKTIIIIIAIPIFTSMLDLIGKILP